MNAPDRFAVLADIHGNSDALRAVLTDMASLGLEQAINLGDHFSGPLDAAGTWHLLASNPMHSLRGNHDRWLIEQAPAQMGASDRCAYDQLPPEALAWLRSQPATLSLWPEVFACHATPGNDNRYWAEHVSPSGEIIPRPLPDIQALSEGITASLLLCAHTHLPRITRLPSGQVLLNPGSVGCPAYTDDHPVPHKVESGNPFASYAMVERRKQDWLITHRHLPYDPARMVRLAQDRNRPDWAHALQTGHIQLSSF